MFHSKKKTTLAFRMFIAQVLRVWCFVVECFCVSVTLFLYHMHRSRAARLSLYLFMIRASACRVAASQTDDDGDEMRLFEMMLLGDGLSGTWNVTLRGVSNSVP